MLINFYRMTEELVSSMLHKISMTLFNFRLENSWYKSSKYLNELYNSTWRMAAIADLTIETAQQQRQLGALKEMSQEDYLKYIQDNRNSAKYFKKKLEDIERCQKILQQILD